MVKLLPSPAAVRGPLGSGWPSPFSCRLSLTGSIETIKVFARHIPRLPRIPAATSKVDRRSSVFKINLLPRFDPMRSRQFPRQRDLIFAGNFTHCFTFAKNIPPVNSARNFRFALSSYLRSKRSLSRRRLSLPSEASAKDGTNRASLPRRSPAGRRLVGPQGLGPAFAG